MKKAGKEQSFESHSEESDSKWGQRFCRPSRFPISRGVTVFSLVAIFTAVVLATPVQTTFGISDSSVNGRPVSEIRKDVRAFVAKSRKAKTEEDVSQAVYDLCLVHREIVADKRFATSRDLQGLRAQLWQRLKSIQKDLKQKIARAEKNRIKDLRAKGFDPTDPSVQGNSDEPSMGNFDFLAEQMAQQMSFANQLTGGPSQVLAYTSGPMGGLPDYGPDLVRLIEDTINPDFWEKNGGPGRIRYYKPLMVLVVTGSMEVHHDLNKMLKTLRMLSR